MRYFQTYRWLTTVRESLAVVPQGVNPIIICDREGDFYELYSEMLSLGTSFVVRITKNRNTINKVCVTQEIRQTPSCGKLELSIPRDTHKNRPARVAKMEVAHCAVSIAKPKFAGSEAPDFLTLNLVRITEIGDTTDEPIEWILATNIPVLTAEDAMKIVTYYVHRWKIERFHYILKSGCQVERIQQRTYERILPIILLYSVISVYLLAMTYTARYAPDTPCDAFLDEHEWKILHRLVTKNTPMPQEPYSIKVAVEYLGQLGSFKHSPSDGEYGVKSIWKGLFKLFDALDVVDRLMG
jgi:hypothetical protein